MLMKDRLYLWDLVNNKYLPTYLKTGDLEDKEIET